MAYALSTRRIPGRIPAAPTRKMGTWKMAYADFLTALMAFFMVMWLVSGTTAEDRSELAQYFTETPTASLTTTIVANSEIPAVLKAIKSQPILADASQNIEIAVEGKIIRIDLHETDGQPLFDMGDGSLNAEGKRLASAAGMALANFPYDLSVEGHTDAFPSSATNFSNWDLSSARANSARRALTNTGIDTARIQAVTGLAGTRPLKAGQPHLSANRRVSILIHTGSQSEEIRNMPGV